MTTFWCKSNPFNDDHVDVDEKQPNLYHDPNDSETGITYQYYYIYSNNPLIDYLSTSNCLN